MEKYRVWLSQVNHAYGSSIFLPYSVGMLEAYARAQKEIDDAFDFAGYIVRRESIDRVLERLEHSGGVDIFGISVYLWNEQYSRALSLAVRARFPGALILIGGPQVPTRTNPFDVWPAADLAVRGEGELAFAAILRAYAARHGVEHHADGELRGDLRGVFGSITGLAIRSDVGHVETGDPERISDLAQLPSPYLTGCFDALLADSATDWQACSETDRGCPYSCTMCDWGSATYSKVRQFPDSRIIAEYEWFGRQQIRYLYNCDANYGLLARDVDLTRVLVETKKLFAFPQEFRACYAKNSNDRVFEIAKVLRDAGMSKGVTMSFQSMDAHTQKTIRRSNIKIDDFQAQIQRYRQHGIVTYTELIMGLPGETKASFRQGLDTLLDAGQHDGINMYLCQMLPNSELNDPAYRQAHEIATVCSPILLQHSSPIADAQQEYNDIVIGTATMSPEDLAESYMLAWSVQTFHCLGLTKFLAMFCRHELGMAYTRFYDELRNWANEQRQSLIGQQYSKTLKVLQRGLRGGDWGVVLPPFGDIVWPTEEASFLSLIALSHQFYGEIHAFLADLFRRCSYCVTQSLINALVDYQSTMMITPDDAEASTVEMPFNCHEYFTALLKGEPVKFVMRDESLLIAPRRTYASLAEYARLVVWYGRKGGRFTQPNVMYYVSTSQDLKV